MSEILMYHHVEPEPLSPATRFPESYITPDEFARQLDRLLELGYTTTTLAEATTSRASGDLPGRRVVLTFDDACRCFATHAAPILTERGLTATVFAVSDLIGGENAWDRDLGERAESLMDDDELRRIASLGFEIGAHSATHADLTAIDDQALRFETVEAKARLEGRIGRAVETFCYPYGRCDERAVAAVREAGFTAAVSISDHGIAERNNPWALPRQVVRPGESLFELRLKASGAYRWWRRLPRLGLLSALRKRSGNG